MTMNPLLYKAHPLLHLTVDMLTNPAAHSLGEASRLILFYLAVNIVWTPWLMWGLKKTAGFSPSFLLAYGLGLPALVFYLPTMLTMLSDVLAHEFHFADRFILVFCVFIASMMLSAFYAVAFRHPRTGRGIGLRDGLTISLFLWLGSLPTGLALLGLNAELKFV